ncbi:hypothetical protein KIPB_002101 [Kipferlia bialata]|uniref:Sacsin/Nov domain-containing protein n=1 Tax=Kipferlia bialata TaxID=797122 RepID=A0A9K3CT33_9EUKA|nr:hypothetical protein KIPB_002101 [Kipferlia bialata]|eukprot:g2101.t1
MVENEADAKLVRKDFGQRVQLVHTIQAILQKYPLGPQIILELAQNADDARASAFAVFIDHTSYGDENILEPTLKCQQTPAVYYSIQTDADQCLFDSGLAKVVPPQYIRGTVTVDLGVFRDGSPTLFQFSVSGPILRVVPDCGVCTT